MVVVVVVVVAGMVVAGVVVRQEGRAFEKEVKRVDR